VPSDACGDPRDDGAADAGAGEYALATPCPKTPPVPASGSAPLSGPGASLRVRKLAGDVLLTWAPAGDPAWNVYRDGDVRVIGTLPPAQAWQSPSSPDATDVGAVLDGAFHAYVVRSLDPCTGREAG
jgi:hypothetical protein